MFNKVILVGNLTRDIDLRYLQSGTAVGSTGIASTKKYKSNGEQKEEVMFIDIVFFSNGAEIANQYLKRGSKVLIEGRLKLDSWIDNNNQKKSKHTVVVEDMKMLDCKKDNLASNQQQSYSQPQGATEFA